MHLKGKRPWREKQQKSDQDVEMKAIAFQRSFPINSFFKA
jgi:hypothetical protein